MMHLCSASLTQELENFFPHLSKHSFLFPWPVPIAANQISVRADFDQSALDPDLSCGREQITNMNGSQWNWTWQKAKTEEAVRRKTKGSEEEVNGLRLPVRRPALRT